MLNPNKYVLKNSKVLFSADRARIIFDSVLNAEEAQLVHTECLKDLKK